MQYSRAIKPETSPTQWILPVGTTSVVFLLCMTLGRPTGEALAVIVHLALAALCTNFFFRVTAQSAVLTLATPLAALTLVEIGYFSSSALKYFSSNPTYPEFALENSTRLAGSCVVGLTLLAQIALIGRRSSRKRDSARLMASLEAIPRLTLVVVAMTLGLAIYLAASNFRSSHSVTASEGITTRAAQGDYALLGAVALFESLATFGIMLLGLRLATSTTRGKKLFTVLGIIVLLVLTSGFLQSREYIAVLLLTVLLSFETTRFAGKARRIAQYTLLLSPILALMGSGVLLQLVGRSTIGGWQERVDEVAYRLDLSDYALSCLQLVPDESPITSAFLNAVPAVLYPEKQEHITPETLLVADTDYPDTLFSSGIRGFGVFGFVAWPLAFALLLRGATAFLETVPGVTGMALLNLLSMTCFNIELGWAETFLVFRTLLMTYVCVIPIVVILGHRLQTSRKQQVGPGKLLVIG